MHNIFCACCYSALTQQFVRGSPSVIPITGYFEDPSRRLLRMKSEEVPRMTPPDSAKFSEDRWKEQKHMESRQTFGKRGHSVSDAQVQYRPVSSEFIGIKHHKHTRKLPPIPKETMQGGIDFQSKQANVQESDDVTRNLLLRQSKPRLCRQRREYSRDSHTPERTMSVKFQDSVSENVDTCGIERYNGSVKLSEVNDTARDLSKSSIESYVFLDDKNEYRVLSMPGRAKSMEYSGKLPGSEKQPSHSKTFDERRKVVNERLDFTDAATTNLSSKLVKDSSPCSGRKERDTKGMVTSSSNGTAERSPKPQQSLTEQLMAIAPTDQRRVQGIVQDVLFEMGEERILQYKSAFAKFDKDSSGIISSKQLRRLLRTLGHNPGDDELRELVNQVDMDENGKIDFNEFIIMIGYFDKANNTSEDLSHIFRVYDEINGGSINVGELKTICSEYLIESVPLENINEMIEFIDLDGDGEIDRDELCRVWSTRW